MSGKIGIYGGTFDPIHFGHLITAQSVMELRNLDKMIFMPCHISPLKKNEQPVSDLHRMNMVSLAVAGHPGFSVSDYEILKEEISYTYDTLLELRKTYSNIELIIGFDNILLFDKWKNPDDIFNLADVVVMKRLTDRFRDESNRFFGKAVFLNTPTIEISSTDIRNRIKSDLPIDFLVPYTVKEYIYSNRLYK